MNEEIPQGPAGPTAEMVPDKPNLGGTKAPCPIVGVGASAGGLEAFTDLVDAIKREQGLAYILVQHLDPNYDSLLPELLGRQGEIDVLTIEDGVAVEPNKVYVLPPNKEVRILDGVLHLEEFEEQRGRRTPIDHFFRSLAEDQTTNAACVVLSGTGSDGASGLRAVKEAGGLTIAQDPSLAKFDGMPNSAVRTGLVDLIISAEKMPDTLVGYFGAPRLALDVEQPGDGEDAPINKSFINRVSEAVLYRTGHDFSNYKHTTLGRRIRRRMQVVGLEDPQDYIKRLTVDQQEGDLLFRDLMINVTSFFRDAEAFEVLKTEVIPKLIEGKGRADTIRIWVPACSSGEEAYSIAILLAEALEGHDGAPKVSIFATDIDPTMLEAARRAVYPLASMVDVPQDLLTKYFIADEKGFGIGPRIRDMVRVSEHSVIKDSPFSRLDLISCRNMLIYFNQTLQARIIPIFHYALSKNGYLFLGPSENLAGHDNLMDVISRRHRIFKRKGNTTTPVNLPIRMPSQITAGERRAEEAREKSIDEDDLQSRIMERYAPPFVVVDTNGNVIYSSGRTGRYLEFGFGRPSQQILELAKTPIRSAVRAVMSGRGGSGRRMRRGVELETDGRIVKLDISAEPVGQGGLLIVFQETSSEDFVQSDEEGVEITPFSDEDRISELEDELKESRQKLRSTIEELETSNEELKSSNEEMMSMNEELQSANEELSTINDELSFKIEALAEANDDIQNLLESTQIATIFVDKDLMVRSFTPEAGERLGLTSADTGRVIDQLRTRADTDRLRDLGLEVLADHATREEDLELRGDTGSFLLRVLPYRTLADEVSGVVYVIVDITSQADANAKIEGLRRDLELRLAEIEQIYLESPVGMCLVDRDLRYIRANDQIAQINGVSAKEMIGASVPEIVPDVADQVVGVLEKVLETGEPELGYVIEGQTAAREGVDRVFLADYTPLRTGQEIRGISIVVQDITDDRAKAAEMRRLMHELQHRVKNMLANVMALVRQARRSERPADEALVRLSERLQALSATNNLLSVQNWRSADLEQMLRNELIEPYGEERCNVSGPKLELNSKAALALAMTFHEMSTNASKYGALSTKNGKVHVEWMLQDRGDGKQVVIIWSETGGPDASAPGRHGFGTSLIEASVEGTLEGKLNASFAEEGLRYEIRVPEHAVLNSSAIEFEDHPILDTSRRQ